MIILKDKSFNINIVLYNNLYLRLFAEIKFGNLLQEFYKYFFEKLFNKIFGNQWYTFMAESKAEIACS